jgi:hypothetical protein
MTFGQHPCAKQRIEAVYGRICHTITLAQRLEASKIVPSFVAAQIRT